MVGKENGWISQNNWLLFLPVRFELEPFCSVAGVVGIDVMVLWGALILKVR